MHTPAVAPPPVLSPEMGIQPGPGHWHMVDQWASTGAFPRAISAARHEQLQMSRFNCNSRRIRGCIIMRFTLTNELQTILELIRDGAVSAMPELDVLTAPLAASKLIALSDETEWKITRLGEILLERCRSSLH